ncbi:hypothetical protein L486_08265 [Kwoniella mangroviensis CBS 10435]|uniref:Uncharacterized protein n=1 Tax=Kwoniella mangroviensis CBS 10435 TaxID=1331196 RepID=A0A1B9IFY6_9TREE|nr:hypothetical protein L486_08265 [Kwoniella mangroviensis CBS 10435]
MTTHQTSICEQALTQSDKTLGVSSKDKNICNDRFEKLVETLAEYGCRSATETFLIVATENEESASRADLMNRINSDGVYKNHIQSFLTRTFEGVSRHYENEHHADTDRMEALENLEFSIERNYPKGITELGVSSRQMYREILARLVSRPKPDSDDESESWKYNQAFDYSTWHTDVGQVPLAFPSPLTNAVAERGIPQVSLRLFQDLSSKLSRYLNTAPGENSSIQLPFRGLWSTRDWAKITETMQPKVLDRFNSVLKEKWHEKTAKDLNSNGSLLELSVDLEVTPSELTTTTPPEVGSVRERFGFNEDSIKVRIVSGDGFFKEIDPPSSEKLSEFVDYNDPRYDLTAQSIREHDEAERLKWR